MRATGAGAEPLLRLAAEDMVARVDLPPLDIADVRRLVEEALAGPVDDDVVRELMRLTAGNPMFLREPVVEIAKPAPPAPPALRAFREELRT